jgi:hypothetical protein
MELINEARTNILAAMKFPLKEKAHLNSFEYFRSYLQENTTTVLQKQYFINAKEKLCCLSSEPNESLKS